MVNKEEIKEVKEELEELKHESFAHEILRDYKKQNKRLFVIWLITFIALVGMVGYTVYLLNDIGVEETTTVTQENESGHNNYIGNNGDITNGKADN